MKNINFGVGTPKRIKVVDLIDYFRSLWFSVVIFKLICGNAVYRIRVKVGTCKRCGLALRRPTGIGLKYYCPTCPFVILLLTFII